MPLLTIREQFIEATGRADLIGNESALGADFFINEGQRMLDRMLESGKSYARYFVDLDVDNRQILVPLPNCRAVMKVFCSDSEKRTELTKIDIHRLREYFREPKGFLTTSRPAFYSPVWARPYPNIVEAATFNQPWALDDVIDAGHESFNAILIMPPPDGLAYTLEVLGLFHSDTLLNDGDVSYWTEQQAGLLVKAAAYQMEVFYRNSEGQKDWIFAIEKEMAQINSDNIEEEASEIHEMEG